MTRSEQGHEVHRDHKFLEVLEVTMEDIVQLYKRRVIITNGGDTSWIHKVISYFEVDST